MSYQREYKDSHLQLHNSVIDTARPVAHPTYPLFPICQLSHPENAPAPPPE